MSTNAALTVLTVATIPGLYSDLDTGDQRGELRASFLALSVGAACSGLAKTPWPFIASCLAVVVMLYIHRSDGVLQDVISGG